MSDLKMIKDDPSFDKVGDIGSSDAFNHEVFADTIHEIIKENDPPLSIGLFGGWGVGKTSIINLLKNKLSKKEASFVYFNAWEYGDDSFRRQFLLSMANSEEIINDKKERDDIVKRLETLNHSKIKQRSEERIEPSKIGFIKLGIFLVIACIGIYLIIHGGYGNKISELGTGIFALLASILVIVYQRIEQVIKVTIDEAYDPQLIFPEQFALEFDKLIEIARRNNKNKKIIIVIDDLDRCDASTIKSILVTMKTFLGSKKCYFIIPMDDTSIVRIFEKGNHNFGYEQLRKYFNISVRIPDPHFDDLIHFAEKMANQYHVHADIAFIAALGYCTDARKMKHFLNLYKIKEAVAIERKKKGFLGNLEVDSINKQLAKLLVLEYQYPEVNKYFTKYSEKMEELTELAYDPTIEVSINFQEIDENYTDKMKFWDYNPGLKDFLKKTNDIRFDNIDILSKLKIPNQEKDLSLAGLNLREILSNLESPDIKSMDSSIIAKNSFQIYQSIIGYLESPISLIIERAYNLSYTLVENNYLDKFYINKLLNEIVRILNDKSYKLALNLKQTIIILNHFDSLEPYRKKQFASKLLIDLPEIDKSGIDFSELINNEQFPSLLKTNNNLANGFGNKLISELTKLKNLKESIVFINDINKINYKVEERIRMNLIVPSPEIVMYAISLIPETMDSFDLDNFQIIRQLVLSVNNPFDFNIINTAFGNKVQSIFNDNIEDKTFNELLKNTAEFIIDFPIYLDELNAIPIAEIIQKYYANFNDEAKIVLILVYHISICSMKQDSVAKEEHLLSYADMVDELAYVYFTQHIDKIGKTYSVENQEREETIKSNIQRKWNFIELQFNLPTEELLNFASYCVNNGTSISIENKKSLISKILGLNDVTLLLPWKSFVINLISNFIYNDQIEIANKIMLNIKDSTKDRGCRQLYLEIFIELPIENIKETHRPDAEYLIEYFKKADDAELTLVVRDNINKIVGLFGDDILKTKVNEIMHYILDQNNIDAYDNTTQICLRYKDHIHSDVWERIASKLESDIHNATLSKEHKDNLLELCKHIPQLSEYQKNELGKCLYYIKENKTDVSFNGKAWEVFDLLLRKNIINNYEESAPEETGD